MASSLTYNVLNILKKYEHLEYTGVAFKTTKVSEPSVEVLLLVGHIYTTSYTTHAYE